MGSNIDPEHNIGHCLEILGIEQAVVLKSTFSWTKPIGFIDQPDFLNGAVLIESTLGRRKFTRYLKDLEKRLGRIKTGHSYGPRTIDLDIIAWNGQIVNNDYYHRDFVRSAVLQIMTQAE